MTEQTKRDLETIIPVVFFATLCGMLVCLLVIYLLAENG